MSVVGELGTNSAEVLKERTPKSAGAVKTSERNKVL